MLVFRSLVGQNAREAPIILKDLEGGGVGSGNEGYGDGEDCS